MRLSAPLLALLWTTPALSQDPITWVTTQLENEIARETFTLTDDGWRSEVHVDMAGTKADFAIELVRSETGAEWKLEILPRTDDSPVVRAKLDGARVTGLVTPGERAIDFAADGPAPFFFENLANGCLYEMSRGFLARAQEGALEPGDVMTAVIAQGAVSLPFELTRFAAPEEGGLWSFAIDFPPGLELSWTCGDDAVPVRIEVPAQHLVVAREGAAPVEDAGGRTAVDSGDWRALLSQPVHEVIVEEGLRVKMRDDVELAVDVHRPDAEGEFPTILVRTPYDRANEGLLNGKRFARRGYAVVVQDVRGRFDSGGEFFPIVHEANDGSDTLDWIAAQPWSDGKVGMIGGSYVGWVQWYAAKSGNPHLRAIVPQVSPPDPDQNIPYEGGVFLLGAAWWSKVLTHMSEGGVGIPDLDWETVLATLPLGDLDQALEAPLAFLDEWLAHPPDDEDYWGPQRYQPHLPEMDVAAMHVTGWFDGDQPGALMNFPVLREHGKDERVRSGQFLIVGPWGHGFNVTRKLGDVDFGEEAVIDMQALELRFFDRYLKGIENGIEASRPVWVFVMGENRWRNEEAWPLPGTRYTQLYLASDGDARRRDGQGRLSLYAADGARPISEIVYDPFDLPEPVGGWDDVTGQIATIDMMQLEDRLDTLDFTSPPLAGPVEMTGPFEAVFWARTSVLDADFAIAIHRITPDGKMRRVAGGIQRLRYRNGADEPLPLGEIAEFAVDCWASSVRFEKGDRIQVEVACSGFPGYARNLGTLEPLATGERAIVAYNTLFHDEERPSYLILPVVPREGAPRIVFEEE